MQLDSLLHTLHAVSFFLSPGPWAYICRYISQFQFSRPRDITSWSLRTWFLCILGSNALSLYNHAVKSTETGWLYILDFVGVGMSTSHIWLACVISYIIMFLSDHVPSRASLLFLDFIIILLQAILTTISYETSLARDMPPDTPDPLSPESIPLTPLSPLPLDGNAKPPGLPLHEDGTDYIIDLRLRTLLWRLSHPPPDPPPRQPVRSEDLLPLPNTTAPLPLSHSLRMFVRARGRDRTATRMTEGSQSSSSQSSARREPDGRGQGSTGEARRLPGGLGLEDEA